MPSADRRQRGQALVELALAAPIIMVLLLATAQVGAILYGQLSVDTATREGARSASLNPDKSGVYTGGGSPTTVTCPGSGSNPVCAAVVNAAGGLDGSSIRTTLSPVGSASACPNNGSHTADGYIGVAVSYDVPIFVPFVDKLLATPGLRVRTITSKVTTRIVPCGITDVSEAS